MKAKTKKTVSVPEDAIALEAKSTVPPDQSEVKQTLDNVCYQCARAESMAGAGLQSASKNFKLDLKRLKSERLELQEALAHNQAKVARINKALLRIGLQIENEQVLDQADALLSLED